MKCKIKNTKEVIQYPQFSIDSAFKSQSTSKLDSDELKTRYEALKSKTILNRQNSAGTDVCASNPVGTTSAFYSTIPIYRNVNTFSMDSNIGWCDYI